MTVKLAEVLDAVRIQPDLISKVDDLGHVTTFCNIALDRVMGLMGIPRMVNKLNGQPLCANDMCDYMRDSPSRFTKVTGDESCARASQGILVIACQKEAGHGHVVPIYPRPMEYSGSWAKNVPMASNVGKTVGIMRMSQVFKTEPEYYSIKI